MEDRDKQLQHHLGGQTHQRGKQEHGPVGGRGNDGLFAQQLEEIIEGLQDRGADALLHAGNQLAVDTAEQHAGQEAEQEPRENQDIGQVSEAVHYNCHSPAPLTV